MRCIILLLIWSMLVLPALGQTLSIDVPETSEPYTLIDVMATPGHNSYLWTVEGPDREESSQWRQISPDCDRITFTGPPGKYRLTIIVTTGDCKLLRATATTTIGGDPQPNPQPEPLPVPGELAAVVVVIESSTQTPQQAAVILAMPWRQYLAGRKIPWRVTDPDVIDQEGNVPSDLKPSLNAAKATAGPDVCFVDSAGKVVCVPLAETPAAMLELVKRQGGER